jgi:hypothetical protein
LRRLSVLLAGALVVAPSFATDPWDVNENFLSFAVADAHWTIDEVFPGTKLIVEGQYSIRRGPGDPPESDCDCDLATTPNRMVGTVAAHLQWGEGESALEYARLSFTALAFQTEYEPATREIRRVRDTTEWGVIQVGFDDPLGIDSYAKLTAFRRGWTWGYKLSDDSPWLFTMAANVSGGYAWADSLDPRYKEISNPIVGTWGNLTVEHERWGKLYLTQRVVNGFTLSSPSAGGPVSREARARFGYINRFSRCLIVDVFTEKRSFNFSDPVLLDLYTKSKRVGIEIGCVF